jgi:hypothetical protein
MMNRQCQALPTRSSLWSRLVLALLVFAGLLAVPTAHGQTLSSITGTVTDSSGSVVQNAKVTATNDATAVSKSVVTSSAGTYTITDVIPGTYTVKIENPGFEVSVHNGVGVEVAKAATVDATLQAGSTTQTVEVTESAIALDTTQPNLNTTLENAVVKELPNQIESGRGRQVDAFVFLAPGVTGSTFSKRINGGVDFENEVVFNGIPMAQSETQGFQTIWNPPFELVSQSNVLRSSFSAQYGLAQGVVTYQTTSGTNQIHGDAFGILRNDFFDAKGAYNLTTPTDKEDNYGFSVGGPVIIPHVYNGKNRTFFFTTFEWYRQNQGQGGTFTLPTAAEKMGNFNGLTNSNNQPTIIYNPQNSNCTAGGNLPGTPFVNNTIPTACFSPLSASLLQYIPNPNLGGFSANANNLLGVLPTRQSPWGFTIDHVINQNQSIHWTEWRDKQTSYGGNDLPATNPLNNFTYYPDLGTVFILNYSWTISPHLVMTAGASWLGELNFQLPQRSGTNPAFPAAPDAPIVPGINFSGNLSPNGFGTSNTDSVNRKLGWAFDNNYLWIKGINTFNIGWEIRRTYQNDNECQQCAGNFNFSNNETANPNATDLSQSGNSFASFLLGDVDSVDRIGSQEERLRNWDVSPYFQDDLKLSKRLTVNLGLRWDVMVPFTAVGNYIVYFNSTIPNPGAGGLPGAATEFGNCTGCAGVTRAAIDWHQLSPRGGFSYELNKKTVLQGGFSQNYLDGGAYEYGTHKVAVNYGNLLVGSYTKNSTGTVDPAFGSWDTNTLPFPANTPFSPTIGNGTSINAFDPKTDGKSAYDVVWSLGVQRELPFNMLLTAAYTGNRGNFLPAQLNPINQLNPAYLTKYGSLLGQLVTSPAAVAAGIPIPYPGFVSQYGSSATVLQALLPYPQYASIFNNFDDSGSALYNAMQVQLEKRYTNGLAFLVSYTLSRMMSNTNSGFTSFAQTALNKNNQKSEWSIDNNDQPNVISIAGTYELPFGKNKMFLNTSNRFVDAVFGGWRLSPILSYAQGSPLEVTVAGNPLGNGPNRPNIVPGVQQEFSYNNVYSGQAVLNAAAFSDPGPWAIGDEPRFISSIRGPWQLNENAALAKSFAFTEHVKAKLEMEYFNLLNRVIFCSPDTNLEDSTFGKVVNCQANTQRQGQAHFTVTF